MSFGTVQIGGLMGPVERFARAVCGLAVVAIIVALAAAAINFALFGPRGF